MIEPRKAINLDELCWQKLITKGAKKSEIDDDKAPVNTNWSKREKEKKVRTGREQCANSI